MKIFYEIGKPLKPGFWHNLTHIHLGTYSKSNLLCWKNFLGVVHKWRQYLLVKNWWGIISSSKKRCEMVERWVKRGKKVNLKRMSSFMDGHHRRWKWRLLHFCCVKLLLLKKQNKTNQLPTRLMSNAKIHYLFFLSLKEKIEILPVSQFLCRWKLTFVERGRREK